MRGGEEESGTDGHSQLGAYRAQEAYCSCVHPPVEGLCHSNSNSSVLICFASFLNVQCRRREQWLRMDAHSMGSQRRGSGCVYRPAYLGQRWP